MRLNNKGFAITTVLYGLLILFVILVSSYLLVLSAKKNRLDNIIKDAENEYNGVSVVENSGNSGSEDNGGTGNDNSGSEDNGGTGNGNSGSEDNGGTGNGNSGSEDNGGTGNGNSGSEDNGETGNGNSGDDNSGSNAGGETVPDDTGNGNNTVTTYNIYLTSNTGGIVFNPSSPLTVNKDGEVSVSFQVPGGKKFSRIECSIPNITGENDHLIGEVTVIFKNVTSDANCTLYLTNISNGGDASA